MAKKIVIKRTTGGVSAPTINTARPRITSTSARPPKRGKGCGCFALIAGVLLIGGILLFAYVMNQPDDPRFMAYREAQRAVTRHLVSPASAKFPDYGRGISVTKVGNDVFIVNGYVDSQNRLGAMLRADWTVYIKTSPVSRGRYTYVASGGFIGEAGWGIDPVNGKLLE